MTRKKQVDVFCRSRFELDDSTCYFTVWLRVHRKKCQHFSEGTLEKVRSKDLGEVGELLNGVVVELKGFDEEEEKGIKGFL